MSRATPPERTKHLFWLKASGSLCLAALIFACTEHTTEPPPDSPLANCEVPPQTLAGEGAAAWGPPELVPIALEYQAVRPNIAVADQTVYIAFEIQTKGPEDRFVTPVDIYVIERRSGAWSDPINVSRSSAPPSLPAMGVDLDGAVHLVWGEKHDGDPEIPPHSPTSMLYVNNEAGIWSSPDTLWFSTNRTGFTLPRRLVAGPGENMHLLFTPAWMDRLNVMHMRRAGGVWSEPSPVPGRAYPDLAFDDDGRMVVTFIAGDSTGPNRVFFTFSGDEGLTWSTPRRMMISGATQAYNSRITVGGDGTLHLIWTRDIDGDLWPDILQHSYSRDGICWSEPAAIPTPPGSPGSAEVVADDAGGLHLVLDYSGGFFDPPFQALYLYWDGNAWSEPDRLFGSDMIGERIGLYRDEAGTLHLALGGDINGVKGIHYATGRVERGP